MHDALKMMKNADAQKMDVQSLHPCNVDPKKRKQWFELFLNYLSYMNGVTGASLSYLCWQSANGAAVNDNDNMMCCLKQQALLAGEVFTEESFIAH